jgi:hypothetical protein
MRMMVVVGVVCAVVGVGAGVALTRTWTPPHPPPAPAAATAPAARDVLLVGPATARLDELDKQELRAVIREELAAQRAASAARSADAAVPNPESHMSSESMRAYDDARVAVDDAIARGTWTERDRSGLRASMAQLPADSRLDLVRPLIVAVNSGKVHFDGRGPLF